MTLRAWARRETRVETKVFCTRRKRIARRHKWTTFVQNAPLPQVSIVARGRQPSCSLYPMNSARLLGHRGSPKQHLENTLESFTAALNAGLDGFELDVQRSLDGVLVTHHDFHLADGRLIAALKFTELPAHVPTLEAVLLLAKERGAYVNVEIKLETSATDGRENETVALIVRYNVAGSDDTQKSTSYLMVAKVGAKSSCVTDVIMPGKKQNEDARTAADAASSKPCKAN